MDQVVTRLHRATSSVVEVAVSRLLRVQLPRDTHTSTYQPWDIDLRTSSHQDLDDGVRVGLDRHVQGGTAGVLQPAHGKDASA